MSSLPPTPLVLAALFIGSPIYAATTVNYYQANAVTGSSSEGTVTAENSGDNVGGGDKNRVITYTIVDIDFNGDGMADTLKVTIQAASSGDIAGIVTRNKNNGSLGFESHGKHYAEDGYYYGHKWQCVEFIKRYYHDTHDHKMPNVWGHAKDFYQSGLTHGSLNSGRNMLQFENSHTERPQAEDLLVWNNPPYGHVAVIAEVHDDHIVVAQQNIYGAPLKKFDLTHENGNWTIMDDTRPAGWLRFTINPSKNPAGWLRLP
jgi:surface antigen